MTCVLMSSLKINTDVYLQTKVKPWIDLVPNGRPHIRPLKTPDLNLMDFCVWGTVEGQPNRIHVTPKKEFLDLPRD
uniref:Uncharacterized protein n=1 Tax=Lepeophtheirus salmonis TaxID=72036 RepID=A0A0K2UMG5_LEPSM